MLKYIVIYLLFNSALVLAEPRANAVFSFEEEYVALSPFSVHIYLLSNSSSKEIKYITNISSSLIDLFLKSKNIIPKANKTIYVNLKFIDLYILNSEQYFTDGNNECVELLKKYKVICSSGIYTGKTLYTKNSNIINSFIGYSKFQGPLSFKNALFHELAHIYFYKYGIYKSISLEEEHKLIEEFLKFIKTQNLDIELDF